MIKLNVSFYTTLVLIAVIVALLIWLGVVDIHALVNDVLASVLAGVAGAYVLYMMVGKRKK